MFVWIVLAGVGVGAVFGLFGAGGSAFATPVLALLGVPGAIAIASPLPAVLPASFVGAKRYLRSGTLDRRTAALAVAGGMPGAVVGALVSSVLGGQRLLVLSGVVLVVIGVRILMPDRAGHAAAAAARRDRRWLVAGAAFGVGVLTGLLANGGGFLLVPLFVIVLGMTTAEAAGTSMVAVAALTVPTLVVHVALGHVDWAVAGAFAAGLIPGSMAGARGSGVLSAVTARRVFGALLVSFAVYFLVNLAR